MLTKALSENGAEKIYIAGRRTQVLEDAARDIGPNAVPITCDVTSPESLREAVATVEREVGYLNLLVCNSGIGGPQVTQPESTTTVEEWSAQHLAHDFSDYLRVFSVNTAAVWYTAMSFLPLLDSGNKKGNVVQTSQVIVISSIAGYNKKAPGGWAYCQSKAAANLIAKQLAVALPRWNMR